jgi:hypothetical protein
MAITDLSDGTVLPPTSAVEARPVSSGSTPPNVSDKEVQFLPPSPEAPPMDRWINSPIQIILTAVAAVSVLLVVALIAGLVCQRRRRNKNKGLRRGQPPTTSAATSDTAERPMHLPQASAPDQGALASAQAPLWSLNTLAEETTSHQDGQSFIQYQQAMQQPVPPPHTQEIALATESSAYSASSGGVQAASAQLQASMQPCRAAARAPDDWTDSWVRGQSPSQAFAASRDGGEACTQELQTLSEKLSEKSQGSKNKFRVRPNKLLSSASTEKPR